MLAFSGNYVTNRAHVIVLNIQGFIHYFLLKYKNRFKTNKIVWLNWYLFSSALFIESMILVVLIRLLKGEIYVNYKCLIMHSGKNLVVPLIILLYIQVNNFIREPLIWMAPLLNCMVKMLYCYSLLKFIQNNIFSLVTNIFR